DTRRCPRSTTSPTASTGSASTSLTPRADDYACGALTRLLLTRHGETEWNATHRWQGFTGPPLNDVGRRQARELAERLRGTPIDAVYSSDTIRALETARILAERRG